MGNKAFAALLGFIWYPISTAGRLSLLTLGMVFFIIPIFMIAFPRNAAQDWWTMHHSFVGALLMGIVVGAAVIVVGVPLLAAAFILFAAASLLISPILGFEKGRKEGLGAIWSNGIKPLLIEAWLYKVIFSNGQEGAETIAIEALFEQHRRGTSSVTRNQEAADTAAAIEASIEQHRRETLGTMTEGQFNALELSSTEFTALKAERRAPLSEREKASIRAIGDAGINTLLENYEYIQHKLKTENCSLSLARPEWQDTILLMKQYRQSPGQPWLAVPASSEIYDKTLLRMAFTGDARHPTVRDNILTPDGYKGCKTRYVFHAFYTDVPNPSFFGTSTPDLEGLSQELNQRATFLRAALGYEGSAVEPVASIAPAGPSF